MRDSTYLSRQFRLVDCPPLSLAVLLTFASAASATDGATSAGELSPRVQGAATAGPDAAERLEDLFRLGELHFAASHFTAEVETRRRIVDCCVELYGEKSWRTRTEREFLRSAEKATRLPPTSQAELREARLAYVEGKRLMQFGAVGEAVVEFLSALEKGECLLGKDPFCAETRLQIGTCYSLLRRYQEALAVLRHARKEMIEVYGNNHNYVADVLFQVADVCICLGQFEDANEAAAEAFRIACSARPTIRCPMPVRSSISLAF